MTPIEKQLVGRSLKLLVSALLSFLASYSFSQTPDVSPDISISVGTEARSQLCVGEAATFTAENRCTADPVGAISYLWGGDVSGALQSVPGTFLTTGNKAATVHVSYLTTEGAVYQGDHSTNFTVKKVASISSAQSTVCLECPGSYQVTTDPANCYEGVTITDPIAPNGQVVSFDTSTGVATVKFNMVSTSDSDKKTVKAKCGAASCTTCTSEASTQVVVAKADSLTRVPSTAASEVCKGDSQEFQVETAPPGHYDLIPTPTCPQSSQVTWNSATGRATVLFDQGAENAVLTATCGPADCGSDPVSISTPVIDIAFNHCPNVGVGVTMSLNAQVTPANRTIKWTVDGEATEFPEGNAFSYDVGDQERDVTIVACDRDLTDCCFELTLHVVGQCDPDTNEPSTIEFNQVAGDCSCSPDDGCLGIPPSNGEAFAFEYDVCYHDNAWHVEVYGGTFNYVKKFCPGVRTEVNTAYDPGVTAGTYCCILADFQPGASTVPPCNHYVSGNCTQAGLTQDLSEFEDFLLVRWATADPLAEQLSVAFACQTMDTPELAMGALEPQAQQIIDTAFNNAVNDWLNAPLDDVIAAINACYQGIIDPIAYRATQENWASCPPSPS